MRTVKQDGREIVRREGRLALSGRSFRARWSDLTASWSSPKWRRLRSYAGEWFIILVIAYFFAGATLLDFDAGQLQQTGEHNESATLPILADVALNRYGEVPLWNPYMLTGFPHSGDFVNHFWNPIATLPVLLWGGINGMKVSVVLSFFVAGTGQWLFAHIFGLRGWFRLWAALLFMVSGGLVLLWRLGWYELLVGAAWFPWCFATTWWALRRQKARSLAIAAICVAMVISTGGGYYPLYLLICLGVLVAMALLWSPAAKRRPILRRAIVIATLSAGLVAVVVLPLIDGYRFTARDAMPELGQQMSQPVSYALVNYIVSAPEWFQMDVLGKGSGWSWFYIGALPLAALTLIPLAFARLRWRRRALATLAMLTVVLLAWQANRHSPVKVIYDWLPFLYNFRFPNRLLIIAAAPLIVLAGTGLQFARLLVSRWGRRWRLGITRKERQDASGGVSVRWLLGAMIVLLMISSVVDVYRVNRGFGFAEQRLNETASRTLRWLKEYDSGPYYTSLGHGQIFWDWLPVGYDLEMPIINFRYNRRIKSLDTQQHPDSPFAASPNYIVTAPGQPQPEGAELVRRFDEVGLWHMPDALPYAFSASPAELQSPGLTNSDVSALDVVLDGVNRVVVSGEPAARGEYLVVLVSDFPGWQLLVDGRPALLQPVNGYLGAALREGQHTYTFEFRPRLHYFGLAVSLLTLTIVCFVIIFQKPQWLCRLLAPH